MHPHRPAQVTLCLLATRADWLTILVALAGMALLFKDSLTLGHAAGDALAMQLKDVLDEVEAARLEAAKARAAARPSAPEKAVASALTAAASTLGRQVAGSLGKSLVRGILGSLFK